MSRPYIHTEGKVSQGTAFVLGGARTELETIAAEFMKFILYASPPYSVPAWKKSASSCSFSSFAMNSARPDGKAKNVQNVAPIRWNLEVAIHALLALYDSGLDHNGKKLLTVSATYLI
jgi:hypothetical protein